MCDIKVILGHDAIISIISSVKQSSKTTIYVIFVLIGLCKTLSQTSLKL